MVNNEQMISVEVDRIASNDILASKATGITEPAFRQTDKITGKVTISPSVKLCHKGITLALVGKYTLDHAPFSKFLVKEIQIFQKGIISSTVSENFCLSDLPLRYDSYYGSRYSLTYSLEVNVSKQVLGKITKSAPIAIFTPLLFVPPSPPINISVDSSTSGFELNIDRQHFASDSYIEGNVTFKGEPITQAFSLILRLVRTERSINLPANKAEREVIESFQIIDGAPRPGLKVPFSVALSPLKLSPTVTIVGSMVVAKYKLELQVVSGNSSRIESTRDVMIYIRPEKSM